VVQSVTEDEPLNHFTRREFIGAALAGAAFSQSGGAQNTPQPQRPNVLFILADDLGYGDLSCYGRPDYKTPVLDNLAKQGLKFTDAYAAAPVCTPTRTAFITGRYPQRLPVGLEEPLQDANMQLGIPPEHPTVASLLKANGYETALIGKWHLGNLPEFGPNRHGFDEFFGINGSSADYFTHHNTAGRFDLYENLEPSKEEGYLTELFTNHAARFIRRKRARPFYLSLHYNAPHWPWEGPNDKAVDHDHRPVEARRNPGSYASTDGGALGTYAEMVQSMDAGIGRVMKALAAARLERTTLVIFTSDNGGERYSFNWPFSFQKMNLWEGGIRIPAIVRWPGVVPAGKVTDQAATTMDWTATILAATGSKQDPTYPLDGEDLAPVLNGARLPYNRTLFWRLTIQDAARMGKWKYLRENGNEHLFDLSADPGEKTELKRKYPEVFEKIRGEYQRWNSQMLPNPRRS
jgi:arylsulfatase A-like enzyme